MNNYLKFFSLVIFLFISATQTFSQITDYELGSSLRNRYTQQTGYFDLSDPDAVNIKIAVWGFVQYPGKYVVPTYTTVSDLLSFAGGPSDASDLEDLRLYRTKEDGTRELIKINFNDVMWEQSLGSKYRRIPNLEAGDILVVPGAPRLYTKDYINIWVTIFSALISLSILILNIVRN